MESVIRAAIVYVFLLLIFRVAGRRTLSEMTMFDFILMMIVSEAVQEALIGDDRSLVNSAIVIITLVSINIGLSLLKLYFPTVETWLDGRPFIIVENGQCLIDRMNKARVDQDDVLETARSSHGLERMDQIKYAVLERDGKISVIPREAQSGTGK